MYYYANGLRASKTVNGTKTDFIWNGNNLAPEKKNGSTTVYTYDRTGIISSKKDNEGLIRFAKDPHGNVVMATQNAALAWAFTYGKNRVDESVEYASCIYSDYFETFYSLCIAIEKDTGRVVHTI